MKNLPGHKIISLTSFYCIFNVFKPQEFNLTNVILSMRKVNGSSNITCHSEHILHNVTAFNETWISLISKEYYCSLKDHSAKSEILRFLFK